LAAQLSKYSEALELMWFQYVVGYDKQEQRSLATTVRKELFDLRRSSLTSLDRARAAFLFLIRPVLIGVVTLGGLIVAALLAWRIRQLGWRRGLKVWGASSGLENSRVDFYERFIRLLEKEGFKRETYQTPIEFAALVGRPEAAIVTTAYNRVRFGEEKLSASEGRQLEEALAKLEAGNSR
jgi:hypothetical protein